MSYGPYFADVYARTRLLDMGIRSSTAKSPVDLPGQQLRKFE